MFTPERPERPSLSTCGRSGRGVRPDDAELVDQVEGREDPEARGAAVLVTEVRLAGDPLAAGDVDMRPRDALGHEVLDEERSRDAGALPLAVGVPDVRHLALHVVLQTLVERGRMNSFPSIESGRLDADRELLIVAEQGGNAVAETHLLGAREGCHGDDGGGTGVSRILDPVREDETAFSVRVADLDRLAGHRLVDAVGHHHPGPEAVDDERHDDDDVATQSAEAHEDGQRGEQGRGGGHVGLHPDHVGRVLDLRPPVVEAHPLQHERDGRSAVGVVRGASEVQETRVELRRHEVSTVVHAGDREHEPHLLLADRGLVEDLERGHVAQVLRKRRLGGLVCFADHLGVERRGLDVGRELGVPPRLTDGSRVLDRDRRDEAEVVAADLGDLRIVLDRQDGNAVLAVEADADELELQGLHRSGLERLARKREVRTDGEVVEHHRSTLLARRVDEERERLRAQLDRPLGGETGHVHVLTRGMCVIGSFAESEEADLATPVHELVRLPRISVEVRGGGRRDGGVPPGELAEARAVAVHVLGVHGHDDELGRDEQARRAHLDRIPGSFHIELLLPPPERRSYVLAVSESKCVWGRLNLIN